MQNGEEKKTPQVETEPFHRDHPLETKKTGTPKPPLKPNEVPLETDTPIERPVAGSTAKVAEPERETIKTPEREVNAIHWSASEAVDFKRSIWWYILLAVLTLAVVGFLVWQKQWITAGLALIIFIAIVIITRRPARTINYTLTNRGLYIEDKFYPFSEFKSFGVRHDGALWTLVLIPVKRFAPETTMFITEDQGEAIVDAFGAVLPMQEVRSDLVEKVTRKLKF